MAATAVPTHTKLQVTDAEERDGFVEYCKMRTCERMQAERTDGKSLFWEQGTLESSAE
jgi:hypothetical protein